jgi:23S rRNA (adenine-N6)-dimethyltransferase
VSADPRTRWGFHQLAEPFARRLVAAARIAPGDLVLDIGAGTGAITGELVAAGARVVAVELHAGRARVLRSRFDSRQVTVVVADAADLRLPRQPFRVVANPPFAITTALLRRVLAPGSRLLSADLVLPAPVAARWAAGRAPGAQRWARAFSVRVVGRLPPTAFRPPAPVPAVVLRIERHRLGGASPNAPPLESVAAARPAVGWVRS